VGQYESEASEIPENAPDAAALTVETRQQTNGSAVRPQVVRETLRRQIGDALRTLRAPALDDEGVHRARKDLKRARANLRLLRPAIGEPVYARANSALRDAARPWSRVRDAKVLVETLDDLLEDEKNAARQALLSKLRAAFEDARLAARDDADAAGDAARSAAVLDEAWQRAERWRVARKPRSTLRKGIERIYRQGRSALARARSEASAENLHEWRKQVKYLAQAMESFADADAGIKLKERAEAVADALGKDHDLVVLQAEIAKLHSESNARSGLFIEIAERRKKLQSKALKRGRALFRRKPKAFVRKLQKR
jgi:CHAD domain-containing protein